MFGLPFLFHNNDIKTQREWIKQRLIVKGYVSRNECLKLYISRLSGHIYVLKERGMEIVGERFGKDYRYLLKGGE